MEASSMVLSLRTSAMTPPYPQSEASAAPRISGLGSPATTLSPLLARRWLRIQRSAVRISLVARILCHGSCLDSMCVAQARSGRMWVDTPQMTSPAFCSLPTYERKRCRHVDLLSESGIDEGE